MGNNCQSCPQSFRSEKQQIICTGFAKSDQQFYDIQIPNSDKFLASYLRQTNYWQENPKKLKKNFPLNKFFYGDWINGLPQGRGIMYQPHKILIDAYFLSGVPNGEGKIIYLNSCSEYDGMLKDGRLNGNGKLINNEQMFTFVGTWIDSQPVKGILTLIKDSNIERVQLVNFLFRQGKIYYRDGRVYEGEIDTKRLVPQGKGKVKFPTFDTKNYYEGQWKNGIYHGFGSFLWKNGEYYIGQYRDGVKSGKGKFKFHNGSQYQGLWFNGKQNGHGIFYDPNGFKIKQGTWKEGHFDLKDRFHSNSQLLKSKPSLTQLKTPMQEIKQQTAKQSKKQVVYFNSLQPQKSNFFSKPQTLKMSAIRPQKIGLT